MAKGQIPPWLAAIQQPIHILQEPQDHTTSADTAFAHTCELA